MTTDLVSSEATDAAQPMDPASQAELQRSMAVLASKGGPAMRLVGTLASFAGHALGRGYKTLAAIPHASQLVQDVTEQALRRAFDVAVLGLAPGRPGPKHLGPAPPASAISSLDAAGNGRSNHDRTRWLARPLVILSGAVGGFVGVPGFLPDATVTSIAIMREIARIAQEEGEDLADEATRASCLLVFALNAGPVEAHSPELSYFSARLMMQGRPLAVLFSEVALRYGLPLSQKFALQAVPLLGAVGGAALNSAFLQHYRTVARAHFTIRRLERSFGSAAVQAAAASAPA